MAVLGKRKVILIGNGFDLACGLKTSYNDFLIELINTHICSNSGVMSVSDKRIEHFLFEVERRKLNPDWFSEINTLKEQYSSKRDLNGYILSLMENGIIISPSDIFGKNLFASIHNQGWQDIELCYLNSILQLANLVDVKSVISIDKKQKLVNDVERVNGQFNELARALRIYLNNLSVDVSNVGLPSVMEAFLKKVMFHGGYHDNQLRSEFLFVDFNYTNTMQNMITQLNSALEIGNHSIEYAQIHGNSLDSKSNFIFGFGNDQSQSYQFLKGLEVPQLRKGMKSLQYNFSDGYKKLRNFTTPYSVRKEYEVHVIGHSCGNTDQTILKPLFTSDNCKAIYLYNHNEELGQREKLLNLDLFFTSQEALYEKVMPYNKDLSIPQLHEVSK